MLAACSFSACSDEKAQEKQQLDSVLALHDKVMGDSELAMKNKNMLDTLIKNNSSDTSKVNPATSLRTQLTSTDAAMENWMHKFNADYTGKSHTEVMEYLHSQHMQLAGIDSAFRSAIDRSTQLLEKTK